MDVARPAGRPPADKRFPLSNVWLGVSVEDQKHADERIPLLLQTPAAVRFISAEPLLGRVDLRIDPFVWDGDFDSSSRKMIANDRRRDRLNWVIVGGESGPGARPLEIAWIRSIVAQCRAASVPCFVKQLGADPRDAGASTLAILSRCDVRNGLAEEQ